MSKLLGYDFVVKYKPGKENTFTDALSHKLECPQDSSISTITLPSPSWCNQLKASYLGDSKLKSIVQQLQHKHLENSNYLLKNGLLFYKDRLYIGASTDLRLLLPTNAHQPTGRPLRVPQDTCPCYKRILLATNATRHQKIYSRM